MDNQSVKLTAEGTEEVLKELDQPAEDSPQRIRLFALMKRIAERLQHRTPPPAPRVVRK